MSGGGGGGPTSSTVTQTNVPEWLRPQVETLIGGATKELFETTPIEGGGQEITRIKPFTPYSQNAEEYVAGFSPLQQQAFGAAGNLQLPGQFGAATAGTQGAALGAAGIGDRYMGMATNPFSMQSFMSPYMQNVVDVQQQQAQRQADIANQAMNAKFAQQGAFGGVRQGLAGAQANAELMRQKQNIQATGLQNAFQQAQQAQQFGANLGLQGLNTALAGYGQLGDLGTKQLAAQRDIIGTQNQMGALQRERDQAVINQRIQNFAQAQENPMLRLNQFNALLRGYAQPGTTTTQYQAAPPMVNQLAGLGTAAYGASKMFAEGGPVSMATGGLPAVNRKVLFDPDSVSLEQVQQGVKNDTLSDLIGVPVALQKQKAAQQPAISVPQDTNTFMDQAMQPVGVAGLPSNLPQSMATGGIVAFNDGGEVERYQYGGFMSPTTARMLATGSSLTPEEQAELARREDSGGGLAGLIGRLMRGVEVPGPVGSVKVPLLSSTTREALRTGQAAVPSREPAATPAATPATTRPAGGPTRFETPSLGALAQRAAPAGITTPELGGIKGLNYVKPDLPDAPTIPKFSAGLSGFDPEEYQRRVEAEAEKLGKAQEPFLTAQKERMQKREARIEKAEKQAPWEALVRAGLTMAQSPKKLGVALAEGATAGLNDFTTAKAALVARKEKLDDLREEQDRFAMNLAQGNRKEARDNATNIRTLQNQADQLGLTAQTAGANLEQQQYATGVTAGLGKAGNENQFNLGVQQLINQRQATAQQGAALRANYDLNVRKLSIIEEQARTGNLQAQARLAEVGRKMTNDFQPYLQALQRSEQYQNSTPTQRQILENRAQQAFQQQFIANLGALGASGIAGLGGTADSTVRLADALLD